MSAPNEFAKQKLVAVYTASDEAEARMVQEVLENAGIRTTINSEIAPGIYPFSSGPLAKQDILVLEADRAEAERILSELPEPESESESDE